MLVYQRVPPLSGRSTGLPPFQGRIDVSEGRPTKHRGKEATQSWPKYTKIPLVVMGEVTYNHAWNWKTTIKYV